MNFINLSNHPSSGWGEEQKQAANIFPFYILIKKAVIASSQNTDEAITA